MNECLAQKYDAKALADWISETPVITDPLALSRAKSAFTDTIACIIAGSQEAAPARVFTALQFAGSGLCTVIGRIETLSAENAAIVNGTAAHALDFDDNFLPAVTHASAVLVPSLLALGEEVGASGDLLLDAYIIGLEVQAWLGRHMIPSHYAAGWHATSTIGAIGAAAACVRILALDNKSALSALSLATSMASGSKLQFGSMAKPLHAGLAARAGIAAARFAAAGVVANENPFEGDWGFVSLHHATENERFEMPDQLSIIKDGLAQKRWPCCASAHRTLDGIQLIMQRHELQSSDIAKIETTIPDSNFQNLRFNTPTTVDESRFSMTYCAAVMALRGGVYLSDFNTEALTSQDVSRMMKKIHMYSAGPSSDRGGSIWDSPATTLLTTTDQRQYQQIVFHPAGTIQEPMSEDDLYRKYSKCAAILLKDDQVEDLYLRLNHFENQKIRHVVSLLRNSAKRQADNILPPGQSNSEGTLSLGAKT